MKTKRSEHIRPTGQLGHGAGRMLVRVALLALVGLSASLSMASAQQGRQAMRDACGADYKSLCAGVQPGGGRIIACLKQNAAKLSPGCAAALSAARRTQ